MGTRGMKGEMGEKGEPGMKGPEGPQGVKGDPVRRAHTYTHTNMYKQQKLQFTPCSEHTLKSMLGPHSIYLLVLSRAVTFVKKCFQ